MVKADYKKELIEFDGDLDDLWKDLYEICSCVYSLTEYHEGKKSLNEHLKKIETEYQKERTELLKSLFEVAHEELIEEENDLLYNGQ